MELPYILKESLKLLIKKPKVFIPRLVTTLLYSFYILLLGKILIDLSSGITSALWNDILSLIPFIVLLPPIDLITYAMYPSMVHDYQSGREISLLNSFKKAIRAWRVILALLILLTVLFVTFLFIMSLFSIALITTKNVLFLFLTIFIILALIIISAILLFFVVPIAVIENKGVIDSFRESFQLGLRHKGNLFRVNLFFMALMLITFLIVMVTNFQGILAYYAILLFVITRFLQALIYTYICIINPYFYIAQK